MRIGFTSLAGLLVSDERALVLGREVDLLRHRLLAEALHLQDAALAVEPFLPDDHPDEEERQRAAEEDRDGVDQRTGDRTDDQEPHYGAAHLAGRRGLWAPGALPGERAR